MAEQPPAGLDPAIAAFYDRTPEESRLEQGPFKLEEARTRELIESHAPPAPATVLDVGGGASARHRDHDVEPLRHWMTDRGAL